MPFGINLRVGSNAGGTKAGGGRGNRVDPKRYVSERGSIERAGGKQLQNILDQQRGTEDWVQVQEG